MSAVTQEEDEVITPAFFFDFKQTNGEPARVRVREIVGIIGVPGGAVVRIMNQHGTQTYRTATSARQLQAAHTAALNRTEGAETV